MLLQVLPEHVPSPLRSFTWDDMREIGVPDMIEQLHIASWLLSDAYPRLSPEATGNASREDLEWAVSVSPTPCIVVILVLFLDLAGRGGGRGGGGGLYITQSCKCNKRNHE